MRITKPHLFLFITTFTASSILAQPTISSFSPASGPVGTSVTITGTNFSTTPSSNIVFFGAVKANVTAASGTSLTVTVPTGATYQPITVMVNGLTGYSPRPFIVTFAGGGQINSNSFGAKQDFVTDIRPNAITFSDFDGDGKSDIATPNNYSTAGFASVSVLRNISSSGLIDFAPKQDYVTGAVTYGIASGDIDGDGKPDIVSTAVVDATVSVFRNTSTSGNINFAPKIDIGTGNAPFGVVIGDIDGDGKSDIVTVNNTAQTISVLRNIGSPGNISFAPKIDFPTLIFPQGITLGDFDGDSKTDIAFTNRLSNSFSIYRNTSTSSNISLAPRVDFSCGAGNEPYGISYGDLDNDSKLDLAVVYNGSTSGGVQLFRNSSVSGTMSFTLSFTPFGTGPTSDNFYAGINDINGDGKLDVALSISGTAAGSVWVYQNNSTTGTFSFGSANFFSASFAPYGIMLGDLEGDGRPDMVISEFTFEKISVFKNRCGYPNISFFSPSTAGANSTVTISGTNFIGVTSVTFGGTPAASFNVINANGLTAVVGPGSSGDIVITTSVGSGSASGFIFAGPPTVTSFTPTNAGFGNTVTISGQNFIGATGVSFGGVAATSFTVVNPTTITAVVGTGASGSASVTNTYGTGSLPGFTHIPFPIINSFTPTNAGQGTTVTISGLNFTGATAVSFGGVVAASFTVVNSTTITAVVGNGASGNVSITNSFGTGVKSGFVFIPAPTISSFTPASAIIGTTVTISGQNFTGATAVSFGGVAASSFTVVNSTTITAQVSNGASGNVSVTTPGGIASLSGFTFISPPVINSFTPASGPIGTVVTISGSNFNNVASNNVVYFGTVQAQVTNATSTLLSVIVPAGANPQNISVTTNNLTATTNQAFIITFNGGGSGFNAGSFSAEAEFIGGLDPYTLHAADLDGDGKPDVIIPDVPFKKISVLKNTSTGGVVSFAPEVEHATSWVPYFVATGDFDGDGKKDVAVTCSDAINIFRNTSTVGNISFAVRQDIPTVPNPPCGITVNDFNGDGRLDIAVWRSGSTVGIFINTTSNGIISFSNTLSFSVGNFGILPLYSHDVDGDNKPDILVPFLNNSSVSVYRNTSSGGVVSFAPNVDFASGYRTAFLTMGDLDGDGKPEIITNSDNSSFTVLKNQSTPGTLSFATKVDFFTNEFNQYFVNAGDLDGDAKIDIACYAHTAAYGVPPTVSVFRNLSTAGNISFADKVAFPILTAAFTILCDFNVDGKLDIGGIAWTTAYFRVISNQVGGTSITSFTPANATTGTTVTITGTNFTGATAVSFGGVAATSFVVNSSTSITAVVASGASGNVSVTTPAGTATLGGFTFFASLAISSFTPTSAGTGATITITGTNFTGAIAVSFGGVAASSFVVNSSTNITAVVASGASGNVSVTTPAGTASLAGFIFIAPPIISSFTPTTASTGATITITGTNFLGATSVSFGGMAATSFVVNSSTSITAIVGAGATGNVSVTTPGGTATATGFTYNTVTGIGGPGSINSNELVVNPNPAKDFLIIKHPATNKNAELNFYDILGRKVKTIFPARNSRQTDVVLNFMTPGIYTIVWSDGTRVLSRIIVVN